MCIRDRYNVDYEDVLTIADFYKNLKHTPKTNLVVKSIPLERYDVIAHHVIRVVHQFEEMQSGHLDWTKGHTLHFS